MRIIFTASLIFVFWFVLSGHTEPLLIVLGIASTGLTVYLSRRMHVIDDESYPYQMGLPLIKYLLYLSKEIFHANIDVIRRILSPGKTIEPQVIELPVPQKSVLGKVIYANSITLTPGTVTLELRDDKVVVHSLSKEGAEELQTGVMAAKVPGQEQTK